METAHGKLFVSQWHGRKASDASFERRVGMSSWVNSLFTWFPADGCPLLWRLSVGKPCGTSEGNRDSRLQLQDQKDGRCNFAPNISTASVGSMMAYSMMSSSRLQWRGTMPPSPPHWDGDWVWVVKSQRTLQSFLGGRCTIGSSSMSLQERWLEDPYEGFDEDRIKNFGPIIVLGLPSRLLLVFLPSLGKHSLSRPPGCCCVAMDRLPRAHCNSGMTHQAGCLPTQIASDVRDDPTRGQ